MYKFILEHDGTPFYNRLSQAFKAELGLHFDSESEEMVGNVEQLHLYTQDMELIGVFSAVPSKEALRLYISLAT